MKNLLILGVLMTTIYSFGQTTKLKKSTNGKTPVTSTELVMCVRPAGGGDPVCRTVDKCQPVDSTTDRGGTVTYCGRVMQVNTQLDKARGVKKKINSTNNNPQAKMMSCRKNADGSESDCVVESGSCSSVIWAEGFVCHDLMVEQVNKQSNQKKDN
jgi:hypothetical protein